MAASESGLSRREGEKAGVQVKGKSTVRYCMNTVLYCTILYCTVLYCTAVHTSTVTP